MLSVRHAVLGDRDSLVDLHLRNVGEDELSMLLGRDFVSAFYDLCLKDPRSRVTVLVRDATIMGMSMTWNDHLSMTRLYRGSVLWQFIVFLLRNLATFRWSRIFKILQHVLVRDAYTVPDDVAPYCVEMTILDRAARTDPKAVIAFFNMFSSNVEKLKGFARGAIWASAQASNRSSVRMIKSIIRPTEQHVLRRRPHEVICFIHRYDQESRVRLDRDPETAG